VAPPEPPGRDEDGKRPPLISIRAYVSPRKWLWRLGGG